MSPLFRRGKPKAVADAKTELPVEPDDAAWVIRPDSHEPTTGPFDQSDVARRGARLDFGALWLPAHAGMTVRMDVQRASGNAVAVTVSHDGSKLQLSVFAAPKSAGLWDEVRGDMARHALEAGGKAAEEDGPFGKELRAVLPVERPDGKKGTAKVRLWGVDGPRWLLRGQLTGKAATDDAAAAPFADLFRDIVVVRGSTPRPPKDLLPLKAPGGKPAEERQDGGGAPELLSRGPEITEVR
jgi:hypothetical protein